MARIYGAGDAKSADTLKGNLEAAPPHKISILVPLPQLPDSLSPPFHLFWLKLSKLASHQQRQSLEQFMSKQILDFYFSIVFICQHLGGFADLTRLLICQWRRQGSPAIISLSLSSIGAHKGVRKNAIWQLTYHCSIVFSKDENFQFLRQGSNFGQRLRVQQE